MIDLAREYIFGCYIPRRLGNCLTYFKIIWRSNKINKDALPHFRRSMCGGLAVGRLTSLINLIINISPLKTKV